MTRIKAVVSEGLGAHRALSRAVLVVVPLTGLAGPGLPVLGPEERRMSFPRLLKDSLVFVIRDSETNNIMNSSPLKLLLFRLQGQRANWCF